MAVRTDFVAGEVLAAQDLDDTFAAKIDYATPVNTQTGTTYTFVLADGLRLTTANNAAASTFTVPPQSSVVWLANSIIRLVNFGAGVVTINGGSGVTVTNTAATVAQFQSVDCIRTGSNAWTVVVAGGGDEPGLVHLNTTTFSAVSSFSIENIFSAEYDNYLINFITSAASAVEPTIRARMRVSGADNTTANYNTQRLLQSTTTVSGSQNPGGNTFWTVGHTDSTNPTGAGYIFHLFAPFLATKTLFWSDDIRTAADGTVLQDKFAGILNLATSFTALTFLTSSGTMSGTVRIYGYKNS